MIAIVAVVVIIIIISFVFIHSEQKLVAVAVKCPENYTMDAERNAEYNKFVADFEAYYPQETIRDFAMARVGFLVGNDCTKTLKYIDDNGGISQYIENIVNNILTDEDEATSTTGTSTEATTTQNDASSYEEKARAFNLSGKYEEALTAANTAISLDENNMDAWIDQAEAYYGFGDCNDATADMYHVAMKEPDNSFVNEFMSEIMNSAKCKS